MSTKDYISTLESLKAGDLGLLRTHAGKGIDNSTQAFDLFAGVWWPLRQQSQAAPRRPVAWLIAKLYAYCPLPSEGDCLARLLGHCQPMEKTARERFRQRFDRMLMQPLEDMEEPLRWALRQITDRQTGIDWVKLTDDLSVWERESKRIEWAKQFLGIK